MQSNKFRGINPFSHEFYLIQLVSVAKSAERIHFSALINQLFQSQTISFFHKYFPICTRVPDFHRAYEQMRVGFDAKPLHKIH